MNTSTLTADTPLFDVNELPLMDTSLHYPSEQEQAEQGFTPGIIDMILKHITLGLNLSDCANIVMLPPSRVWHWYNKNYCNFKFAADYATADSKRRLVRHQVEAVDALKVKASQFMLERKYRNEYGKEIKIEVNHTMIDNISKIVFDKAVRFIQDPEKLKLFIQEIASEMSMLRNNDMAITVPSTKTLGITL